MNKTKRKLQLTAAIINIVLGVVSIIACIILLTSIGTFIDRLCANDPQLADFIKEIGEGVIYGAVIIAMLFSIVIIICAGFMCPNPDKKNTQYKGLTITLLVFDILLLLSSFANCSDAAGIIDVILCLINVGLLIASLCIKDTTKGETICVNQNGETTKYSTSQSNEQQAHATGNDNIDSIRKLHEDGVISEEEMKTLIKKELDK